MTRIYKPKYKKRSNAKLCRLHTEVEEQTMADLKKMAESEGITVGWVIDKLRRAEIARRERRMEKQEMKQGRTEHA